MSLTSKIVRAVLCHPEMRSWLLRDKHLTEDEYRNFDLLDKDKRDCASDNVIEALEGFAPFQIRYGSPVDQYPDDASVCGLRGAWMLKTQDGTEFFSNKRAAIHLASSISRTSWAVAKEMGHFDNEEDR